MKTTTLRQLCAGGLTAAPAQALGSIRIVPLIRDEVREDLRLAVRNYDEDLTATQVKGSKKTSTWYYSYVPYGLVVGWTTDGSAAVPQESRIEKRDRLKVSDRTIGIGHRMVRRAGVGALRMLPLHVAMEGFLGLHFRGPNMQWEEYSMQALTHGLSPRTEATVRGEEILGLEDALRVFERHEGQCGMLLFVADALASAMVVGHPDDYGALHAALIEDYFGDLIWQYGCMYSRVQELAYDGPPPAAENLEDLRRHVASMRADRSDIYASMAGGLFDRDVAGERVYSLGPFELERFITDLSLDAENHIGECIRRDDGTVEYLKTYRLSSAQTRRAHLLKSLAAHDWNLDEAAKSLNTDKKSLILRIDKAGFSALLLAHVLDKARRGR